MKIWLELIGYAGTALILLSMMMTSVTKLRWLNLLGSAFSVCYALLTDAMPVFVLNFCLAVINGVQLFRLHRQKKEERNETAY